jgi:hypothetical protein
MSPGDDYIHTPSHLKSKDKRSFGYLFWGVLIFLLGIAYPLQSQEHRKIIETVRVENVEIPVRVFSGSRQVGGLKKEDFQLWVNGKKKTINGFNEIRKKIGNKLSPESGNSPADLGAYPPRFFVLIFNLSSYYQDLDSILDILFKRVIRRGDLLMVVTNHYVISEWKVVSEERARHKLKAALDNEIHHLKFEMVGFETELKSLAATLKSRLANPLESQSPNAIFRDFFQRYQSILEDIKDNYLDLPLDQCIQIAVYLKTLPMETWVLNFFQLSRLPLLDSFGPVHQLLMRYINEGEPSVKHSLQSLYQEFCTRLKLLDTLFLRDIGKTFLNSGATVHTQLLKPLSAYLSNDFTYETVTIESESILRNLSRLTGGAVVSSNRTGKFIKDITQKEDIVYLLTYVPDRSKRKRKERITIKVNNPHFRVNYDNQQRLKSFGKMMARLTKDIKDIEIESLACYGDLVTFNLKNIRVVQYEGKPFWAVQTNIKILDQRSRLITTVEKLFSGRVSEGAIQVELPSLPEGEYHIVLEVKDLFALKRIVAGDAIHITRNKSIQQQL